MRSVPSKARKTVKRCRIVAIVTILLAGAACSDESGARRTPDGGAGADRGPVTSVSCSDLTGLWKVTAWTCNGAATDLVGFGVELSRTFSSAPSGAEVTKFFVPPGQATTWFSRTRGLTVAYTSGTVSLSGAAPAEQCATHLAPASSWGPVATGIGDQSCTTNTNAPGAGPAVVWTCAAAGPTVLTFSMIAPGNDGPCPAGQSSVQTWTKQ